MQRERDLYRDFEYRDFEQLARQDGPHSRGLRLEPLVAEMFKQAGYEVRLASKTAAPRRTDLVAIKGRDLFLVEVKWQKDPADVDVVDSYGPACPVPISPREGFSSA
jgi:hypothetical protein